MSLLLFFQSSGAEAITGTAAVSWTVSALSASGLETFSGTMTLTDGAIALSGTGAETYSGSGAVAFPAVALSATGAEGFAGDAAVAFAVPAWSADGGEAFIGEGSIIAPANAFEGTGVQAIIGSGAEAFAVANLSSEGAEQFSGTGAFAAATPDPRGSESLEPVTGTADLSFSFSLAANGTHTVPQIALPPVIWRGSIVAPQIPPRQVPAIAGVARVSVAVPALLATGVATHIGQSQLERAAPVLEGHGGITIQGIGLAVGRSAVVASGGVWNTQKRQPVIQGAAAMAARASVAGTADVVTPQPSPVVRRRRQPSSIPLPAVPLSLHSCISDDDWFLEDVA